MSSFSGRSERHRRCSRDMPMPRSGSCRWIGSRQAPTASSYLMSRAIWTRFAAPPYEFSTARCVPWCTWPARRRRLESSSDPLVRGLRRGQPLDTRGRSHVCATRGSRSWFSYSRRLSRRRQSLRRKWPYTV